YLPFTASHTSAILGEKSKELSDFACISKGCARFVKSLKDTENRAFDRIRQMLSPVIHLTLASESAAKRRVSTFRKIIIHMRHAQALQATLLSMINVSAVVLRGVKNSHDITFLQQLPKALDITLQQDPNAEGNT